MADTKPKKKPASSKVGREIVSLELQDIRRRREARPTKPEVHNALQKAKAVGMSVAEMSELSGIQVAYIYNHFPDVKPAAG